MQGSISSAGGRWVWVLMMVLAAGGAEARAAINIRVVDKDGKPVAGASIHVNARMRNLTTDASGCLVLSAAPVEGDFSVAALSQDRTLGGIAQVKAGSENVTIKAERTAAYDGRAFTTEGQPASGLSFSIGMMSGNELVTLQEVTADGEGRFKVGNLIPTATYRVWWRGGNDTNRDYDFGNATINLAKLKPGEAITFKAAQYLNTLIGRVVTEKGEPIAGAAVEVGSTGLWPQEFRQGPGQPGKAMLTDNKGEFTIQRLAPGTIKLRISAKSYRASSLYARTDSVDFKALLRTGETPLRYRVMVLDENETPVGGATVVLEVKSYGGSEKETATSMKYQTEENGRVTIEPPARDEGRGRTCLIYCDTPGRDVGVYGAHGSEDEEVRLLAPRSAGHWRGKVVDSGGKPVAGANVKVTTIPSYSLPDDMSSAHLGTGWFADETTASLGLRQRSDEQGEFEFVRLGRMAIGAKITAAGHAPLEGDFRSHREADVDQKVFTLLPAATVKGRLVLKATKQPPGEKGEGRIAFTRANGGAPVAYANVQPDWTFSCTELPIGPYRLQAYLNSKSLRKYSGPAPAMTDAVAGKTTEAVVELQQAIAVRGKLIDSKTRQPVRAMVSATLQQTISKITYAQVENDGSWELYLPQEGEYKLNYYLLEPGSSSRVSPPREFKTITVEEGRAVEGLVIEAEGEAK